MLRSLLPLVFAVALTPAHALSAAEQLRLQRIDETTCGWLQAYTEIKIESCTLGKRDMFVVPARNISKSQALDLMATAAVAAEMNRKSPFVLGVALSPKMDRYIRVKGEPVTFRGTDSPKEAMRTLSKAAVECRMNSSGSQCPGEPPDKLVPVQ